MRQVMPHRNNIGGDCPSCKTFLHSMGARPLISGDCCNPVRGRQRGVNGHKANFINDL